MAVLDLFRLDGKRALITGGRRVGGELAKLLASRGMSIAMTFHTRPEAIERTLEEIRATLAAAPAGEPRTLFGSFTFADIAVAQVLVSVEPPASGLKLRPASRRHSQPPRRIVTRE